MQTVRVHARTILGDAERSLQIAPRTPTGEVALSFANAFQLPVNVPWGLRDDAAGMFLDDSTAIGTYVTDGELKTVVTPKAHLG